MTDTLTALSTDEVLVGMLTENTGSHFLDSGGAYGRNWEKNGGLTPELANEQSDVNVSVWERDGKSVVEYVTIDVFHFLSDRVDYNAEVDAAFREFALSPEMADEHWFTCLEAYLESIGAKWEGTPGGITVNTYNGEDCLSQIIQYTIFEHPDTDESMAAISIHGGCDARGGYTAPRMFDLGTYHEYALFDNADITVVMTEPDATPEQLAQSAMFPDYPVPTGGRRVIIDFRGGGSGERNVWPEDASLDPITFEFGETPITVLEGGGYVVADGPGVGWELSFYAPCAG